MKKVFGIFLSIVAIVAMSACERMESDELQCLTFVSSGESSIRLVRDGSPSSISLEYSKDGDTWEPYFTGTIIKLSDGEQVMLRSDADGRGVFSSEEGYYMFKITGTVAAKGNIMYLLDQKCRIKSLTAKSFYNLFMGCEGLTSAPDLPATNLAESCYSGMFNGCSSLTKAPKLPAKELAFNCYGGMFYGCTSLKEAPELPAVKLAPWCYSAMFFDCANLTSAPKLPAKELAANCYNSMFYGCSSLTSAPELPATEVFEGSYYGMFSECSKLNKAQDVLPARDMAVACYARMFYNCRCLSAAPALPASELVTRCYDGMFTGCTSLDYVKALFTTTPSKETTYNWLKGVSGVGKFVKSKDATWDVTGSHGVPMGWTVETE